MTLNPIYLNGDLIVPPFPVPLYDDFTPDPDPAFIEQGWLADIDTLARLDIIDWKRCPTSMNQFQAITKLARWLVNSTVFTVIQDDLRAYPKRDDWPGWQHVGQHEDLGRLYWNMFHAKHEGDLHFRGSLWISVLDERTQVVLDPQVDLGHLLSRAFKL